MGLLVQRDSFGMETHMVFGHLQLMVPLGRWAGKQVWAGAEGPAHLPQGHVSIAVVLYH